MCRSIKTLYNFEPVATEEEIAAAARQFVRKVSGFRKPSKVNEVVFETAVSDIAHITQALLDNLTTNAPPRNREAEAEKARQRWQRNRS
ncbi:MAG: DUF2277 domain-containing protein [Chloroflexota bacterium]